MSATNRKRADGSVYKRRPADYYSTPEWVTESALNRFETRYPDMSWDRVLEPAAGNGAITRVMRRKRQVKHLTTVEIMPSRSIALKLYTRPNRHYAGDFRSFANLEARKGTKYSVILTNPPFSHAEAFVMRSLSLLRPDGYLALLLRLAFLESQERAEMHRKYPSDVFVLPRRPSFTGDGQSDMSAYAWFVWGPGCGGRWEVLPTTSVLGERFFDITSSMLIPGPCLPLSTR